MVKKDVGSSVVVIPMIRVYVKLDTLDISVKKHVGITSKKIMTFASLPTFPSRFSEPYLDAFLPPPPFYDILLSGFFFHPSIFSFRFSVLSFSFFLPFYFPFYFPSFSFPFFLSLSPFFFISFFVILFSFSSSSFFSKAPLHICPTTKHTP